MMGKPSSSAKLSENRAQNATLATPKWRLPAVLPRIQKITSLLTKNYMVMMFTSRWQKIGPRFGRSNF